MIASLHSVGPAICQIGFSVADLERSLSWYEPFGFERTGGHPKIDGREAGMLLGLEDVSASSAWLVGREPFTQLEFTAFVTPQPQQAPKEATPLWPGFSSLTLVTQDFDEAVSLCGRRGDLVRLAANGEAARVRDPDGVWVLLLKSDVMAPRPARGAARAQASIRAVTLSVRSRAAALRYWRDTLGLMDHGGLLPSTMTAMGAMDVLCGGDVLLQIVDAAPDAPLRNFNLYDAGIANIALLARDKARFDAIAAAVIDSGAKTTTPQPMDAGWAAALYGFDSEGNGVEICYLETQMAERLGFRT